MYALALTSARTMSTTRRAVHGGWTAGHRRPVRSVHPSRAGKGGRGTVDDAKVPRLDPLGTTTINATPKLEGMFHPFDEGG